jgi:hypothetical protein
MDWKKFYEDLDEQRRLTAEAQQKIEEFRQRSEELRQRSEELRKRSEELALISAENARRQEERRLENEARRLEMERELEDVRQKGAEFDKVIAHLKKIDEAREAQLFQSYYGRIKREV